MSKIAIIGPAFPYRGGIAAYNERLAEHLEKEHYVTIYTFTLQYPSFLFPGKTQLSEENEPENLTIVECINSINPLNWIKVGRQIKKEKFDIVIVRYWLPFMAPALGTIMRIVRKNKNTKTLAIVDNMIPHEKRIGDSILSKYFVNSVDRFLAMTQQVADDISKFDNVKQKIISPHPLYDHFGEIMTRGKALNDLKLDHAHRYILFFGLIREYKGLDLLIDAFSKVDYHKNNIRLIIAGEFYSDKTTYLNQIKKLNLENEIIIHDYFIPDAKVADYFNASSVVVQPYKTATQSGITQIAYHFNKPMIVTNVGGLPEMCPDGKVGYVVEPNADSIAEAISNFFDGDEHRFEENIKELKNQYSWEILVKNIFKVLN